jgi:peptidoglycan-N-acetylmuramic acid deacetylase
VFLLHNVGPKLNSNYNTPDEVLLCKGPISFDGIYRNVWVHREILKPKLDGAILFVMGDYVGKDNSFDKGQYLEAYCDWKEIMDLVFDYGCLLGWHTWSHPDLRQLSEDEIRKELTPPMPMKHVAYPYGQFDERVLRIAKECGFVNGWSVTQGDDSQFQKKRRYL